MPPSRLLLPPSTSILGTSSPDAARRTRGGPEGAGGPRAPHLPPPHDAQDGLQLERRHRRRHLRRPNERSGGTLVGTNLYNPERKGKQTPLRASFCALLAGSPRGRGAPDAARGPLRIGRSDGPPRARRRGRSGREGPGIHELQHLLKGSLSRERGGGGGGDYHGRRGERIPLDERPPQIRPPGPSPRPGRESGESPSPNSQAGRRNGGAETEGPREGRERRENRGESGPQPHRTPARCPLEDAKVPLPKEERRDFGLDPHTKPAARRLGLSEVSPERARARGRGAA